ncbi:MAG: SPOR domain-containing protein [Gemmatimonadota bacterium]|nr:SPOR domain-containing protein [Gemmatimonadota bacterium]
MTASRRSRGRRLPGRGSCRAWALAILAAAPSWGLSVPSAAQAAQAGAPVDLDLLEARIEAGRFEGAAEAIESWFAAEARNAARGDVLRARYLRARLLADPDSARAELLSVAMDGSSRHGSRAWLRLAQLDLALDEPSRAAADLERLRSDHPRSAETVESWYWTARTFEARGLIDRACEAWQRAAAEGRRVGATETERLAEVASLGCAPGAPRFAIQVGAFSRRDPAEEMRGRLETAGFFSRVIEYDGLHRVRLGRFARREAAESLARRLRDAGFEPAVIPIVS